MLIDVTANLKSCMLHVDVIFLRFCSMACILFTVSDTDNCVLLLE